MNTLFLPICRDDLIRRDWYYYDFLLITGDAYVDHPSFGTPLIARLLESKGFRVALLPQPDWRNPSDLLDIGRPRFAAMLSAGNLDSMVAHYTAAKRPRSEDFYSPGKKTGFRPDRASLIYSKLVKQAFPGLPIIIGGLEASLRRFAHYDFWDNTVRPCILSESDADLLVYGMGERATIEIASALRCGIPISDLNHIPGTARLSDTINSKYKTILCPSFEAVRSNKRDYAAACMLQYSEHDPRNGNAVVQPHGDRFLIVNPPALPLNTAELDALAALPFTREPHPIYDSAGSIPAIEEVRFSLIHNRGCFGACNFCSLAFHQGRIVSSRSHDSLISEVRSFTNHPQFKGYVHDVGGPTANFRNPSCHKQLSAGMCRNKNCLTPSPCSNLNADHSDYMKLLRKLRSIDGVKKVFIRSGIRFDFLLRDKNPEFLAELVKYHISGQLKIAPEHCIDSVLLRMGKPPASVYEAFVSKYDRLNKKYGKQQYLVPYLMSSHPGCTLQDAVELAVYLNTHGIHPEQVQDFYPTPGTLSTCMYYTGLDPRDMSPVYVPFTKHERSLQRALLQWFRPENRLRVLEALNKTGRRDLIGYAKHCLIKPQHKKSPNKTTGRAGGNRK